jgi:hypothetical protein
MNSLAKLAIDAHGGQDRWNQFKTVSADLVQGGVLWHVKGQAGTLDKTNVTVGLRAEWASHFPFGTTDRRSRFEPGRVVIEAVDGAVLEELRGPRKYFAGHSLETPWTSLQLAYFAGCAMWTYLNTPFCWLRPSCGVQEIFAVKKMAKPGASGRPVSDSITTHSSKQTLYFDKTGS